MFVKNVERSRNLFGCESVCFDLVLGTTNQYRKDGKVLLQVSMTQYK